MAGAAKHTILKLIADPGAACAEYQDKVFRNLSCKRIQFDEIWQFCYAKQQKTSQKRKKVNSDSVMFGHGSRLTLRQS